MRRTVERDGLVRAAELVAGDALVVAVVGRLELAHGQPQRHAAVQLVELVRYILTRQVRMYPYDCTY